MRTENQILKFRCLEKNRKTIFVLQNISLYKNPKELIYYLDDKIEWDVKRII